jgi:alpha-methylacyl-CoA racemase
VNALPLAGIRILDLTRQLPGPLATQTLADYGADVIKIEDTRGGDDFRSTQPSINGVAARHLQLNRNKRGLALDLKQPEGRKIFLELAAQSQVVFEQFRPGVVKRLGIDYEAVREVNPRIVYCSLSGFGQDGPHRNMVAHDPNYLALSGVLGLVGRSGGEPVLSGPQLADITAAHLSTIGILMALRNAEVHGTGEYLDMSLFDAAFSLPVTALSTYLGGEAAPSRGQERHNGKYPWADIYRTSDGKFITIAAIEGPFYRNLCLALDRSEWLGDQYAAQERQQHIRAEMTRIFGEHTRDEWFARLKDKEVCISPVLSVEEAVESEQVKVRNSIIAHEHPVAGPTRLQASPIRMRSVPVTVRMGAPAQGEHSVAILEELGYSKEDIGRLRGAGVMLAPD